MTNEENTAIWREWEEIWMWMKLQALEVMWNLWFRMRIVRSLCWMIWQEKEWWQFTVCCPERWFAFQTCIWNSVYLNLNWRMTEKYSVLTTAGREEMRWSWTFASASESTSFRNGYALLYMADVFFSIFSIFLQFIFHLQRKENSCYILCQIISCKLFSIDVRW